TLEILQGLDGLIEREDAVDDRSKLVGRDGSDHRLKHSPGADEDPLEADVLHQDRDRVELTAAAQDPDQGDIPAQTSSTHRPGKGPRAADLDDEVDSLPLRELPDAFVP